MLISDYSSVYFDYLLLDRPILFTDKDIDDYAANRGIMLEPLDLWRPEEISVTVGMQGDYYVEVSGEGLDENTRVYYTMPMVESSSSSDLDEGGGAMIMPGGHQGGAGGGPGGGPGRF